ncbi:MAG: DUF4440 domain-containing protein [Betaproteobacteria bacterium]|jgi:ketosteroid isomerase-like protein|nr:nuclear transport factor 2 family protein [Pseudomonadota bacterium]NBO02838.1 DUF4440 domain-containing protein [Betaproteobacteria bacterium]NBO95957.1 DUF4440 domain-containing protein [Betaproteobacteria bacterium]NBP34852.1 DUF4440 domain-containing protein [Betaproteobacteria bacterium]NBP38415.1 DUF4440 domain-containing protein [Betaproteobacteria bacterium]
MKNKLSPRRYDSSEAAEDAVYEALAQGDLEALMALWSDEEDSVCIHPSGPRLIGLDAIRQSWALILAQGNLVVNRSKLQVIAAGTVAVHNLIETIQVFEAGHTRAFHMACTNVYMHGSRGWRMVLHHAAAVQHHDEPESTAIPQSRVLH